MAVEITIKSANTPGQQIAPSAVRMDSNTIERLASAGVSASKFNKMTWPIGATRWSSFWGLFSRKDTGRILNFASETGPVQLNLGELVFDNMFVRQPVQTIQFETGVSGPITTLYAIELVDARYFWQDDVLATGEGVARGFNVTTDDKTKFYKGTLDTVDLEEIPFTYKRALELLADELAPFAGVDDFLFTDDNETLESDIGLRDIAPGGEIPVAEIIDKLLQLSGYILIANRTGDEGARYITSSVRLGESGLALFVLTSEEANLLSGGFSSVGEVAGNFSPWVQRFFPIPGSMEVEIPTNISVTFPIAIQGGSGYSRNDENDDGPSVFVTNRWHVILNSTGRPEDGNGVGNGNFTTVYDPQWAIIDALGEVTNEDELQVRAAVVAENYYGRFRAGSGAVVLSGLIPMTQWAGADEIEWSVNMDGLWTRVMGTLHNPLFGYDYKQPVTATRMLSIGGVRGMPAIDGGALFDTPVQSESFPARITASQPVINPDVPNSGNVFEYDWIELVVDVNTGFYIDKVNGRTSAEFGKAKNRAEDTNTETIIDTTLKPQSYGVLAGEEIFTGQCRDDDLGGCEPSDIRITTTLLPIRNGAPVDMRLELAIDPQGILTGQSVARFNAGNDVEVTCEPL